MFDFIIHLVIIFFCVCSAVVQTQSKLSDEKQFREKEAADNLAMMKELQRKLTEERHARLIFFC